MPAIAGWADLGVLRYGRLGLDVFALRSPWAGIREPRRPQHGLEPAQVCELAAAICERHRLAQGALELGVPLESILQLQAQLVLGADAADGRSLRLWVLRPRPPGGVGCLAHLLPSCASGRYNPSQPATKAASGRSPS